MQLKSFFFVVVVDATTIPATNIYVFDLTSAVLVNFQCNINYFLNSLCNQI